VHCDNSNIDEEYNPLRTQFRRDFVYPGRLLCSLITVHMYCVVRGVCYDHSSIVGNSIIQSSENKSVEKPTPNPKYRALKEVDTSFREKVVPRRPGSGDDHIVERRL